MLELVRIAGCNISGWRGQGLRRFGAWGVRAMPDSCTSKARAFHEVVGQEGYSRGTCAQAQLLSSSLKEVFTVDP